MKVIFAYRYFSLGGVESVLLNRRKALSDLGVEVDLLFAAKRVDGLFAESDPKVFFLTEKDKIKDLFQNGKYDVASVIDSPGFFPLLKEADFSGVVVNECHTSDRKYLEYLKTISSFNFIKAIVSPSSYWTKWLRKEFSLNVPVVRLPNGVDITTFRYHSKTGTNFKYGEIIPTDRPLVLWVGRLDRAKNPLSFVKVLQGLKRQGLPCAGLIVSSDTYSPLLNAVENRLTQYGLSKDVIHLRGVSYDDMPYIYSAVVRSGGCLLSTSLRECYPMVLLEAMACGCVVVASNVPGNRELIDHGYDGYLFPHNNLKEAIRYIRRLLLNHVQARGLAKRALAKVRGQNATQMVIPKHLKFYEYLQSR